MCLSAMVQTLQDSLQEIIYIAQTNCFGPMVVQREKYMLKKINGIRLH